MANKKYIKEEVIKNLTKLKNELGHEPNAFEIDACAYLPSSRQVQRRFGGLQTLRKDAGFESFNHCAGEKRANIASMANKRASKYEAEVINKLFIKYHDNKNFSKTVTRHYAYQQWLPDEGHYINIACDVAITDRVKKHVVLIDFFYPKDMNSFTGCVRSKINKLEKHPVSLFNCTYEVLFVCMNPDITQKTIDENEIKKIKVLSMNNFQELFY
jgi:hypothetical protein